MAAYCAAVSLYQAIRSILKFSDILLPPVGLKAYRFAFKESNSFIMFVEGLDSRSRKRMKASLARIAETLRVSYDFVYRNGTVPNYEECEGISRLIDFLVEEMNKVKEEYYRLPHEDEDASSSRVVSKSKIVGLRDKRRQFKEHIINPRHQQSCISMPGMAGIGKTAIAREIFEDLDISECFQCRAWVTVGFDWKTKEITEAILAQVDPAKVDHEGHNTMVMVERLKESLKGKRYLIVLDDVWHKCVHRYWEIVFPNNRNGSRVIITSRLNLVAIRVNNINYCLADMRLLDKEESWDLLREKVFAGDSCPPHLEDAGKKIAEKCDGLPLTIIAVADLLSNAEESLWIDAAIKKKHQLFNDAYAQIWQVLYPSYEWLTDEAKFCLLYMSAFPQKYEIPKSRLINLWIVEELIEQRIGKTLETVALEMLEGLHSHNLVMVYQNDINSFLGSFGAHIKTCGLHSSWWHSLQIEASHNKLFHVLDSYDNSLEEAIKGHTRLSIHTNVLFALKDVHNSIEEICASSAHSLLCFGPYSQYMVPVCFGLKFLRRLDALNIRFYDFPLEVLELVMLTYLALTCNRNLPPTIYVLQKLQYLIVQPHSSIKSEADQPNLPIEIWDMKRLKHLQVVGRDLPDSGDTSLEKLQTLSGVTTSSCTILNRVPNITKLGIKIELTPDAAEPLCCFDHVSHLTKLESLTCVIVNPERKFEVVAPFPCLPYSLTKLNLNGLGYRWEEMSKIASLPNLRVLKLRYNAFQGPTWEVEENGFPALRTLLIEDIDLVTLRWAPGSFKSLEVLRIKHCYKLEELLLGHNKNVCEIEVVDCNHWVEWYVKRNAQDFLLHNFKMHTSWK